MEFLENIDKTYYIVGFGIIFIIGHFIVRRKDNFKLSLKYYLFSYGTILLLYSSTIPHVFPGYPHASDLDNKKWLLDHLQQSNNDLAKTTGAIRDMAFMTFIFIGIITGQVIQHLKLDKTKDS